MRDSKPLFSFTIEDRDDALVAVHRAAYAGWISAGLTALLVVLALSGIGFGGLVDTWSLIDVGLMAALAYGTYRGSRFAAVGMLALYLLGQVILRLESGAMGGIVVAVVFILFFVGGVRGAFYLHRDRDDPELSAQLEALEAGPGAEHGA